MTWHSRNNKSGALAAALPYTAVVIGVILCTAVFAPATQSVLAASAAPAAEARVTVLEADERSALVAFTIGRYSFDSVVLDGQRYDRIHVPGTVDQEIAGAPVVPVLGTMLGIGAPESLRVAVVSAEYQDAAGYRLHPAASTALTAGELEELADAELASAHSPDPAIYQRDAFYPHQIVETATPGQIRDQAVAQLQFYPVRVNPVRALVRVYSRIVVRVTWEPSVAVAADRTASPAFEQVLQGALPNYDQLDRPQPQWPGPTTGAVSVAEAGVGAADAALKIIVDADGFYRVTQPALVQAGLQVGGLDPRTLKLHNRGVEIPILVAGEQDGVFDAGDSILFYGTAVTNIYTSQNVYWLTGGGGQGKRMAAPNGTPGGDPVATHFPVQLHAEQDTIYWLTMPNGAGKDHWFWEGRIGPNASGIPASRAYPVALQNLAAGQPHATVRVHLQGYTEQTHRTRIFLNDTQIDDQAWEGQVTFTHTVTVAHSLLKEGANTVKVETLDTGAAVDQLYLNWFEIDYWDTYVAEDDALVFGAPQAGSFTFRVQGFGDSAVAVFDITDPAAPKRLAGVQVEPEGGKQTAVFGAAATTATRFAALTPAAERAPLAIVQDTPSTWAAPQNGADYLLITYGDFYSDTLPLATYHAGNGLRVAVIDVQDLYDEFNHGIFDPAAIRTFIHHAYENWQAPAPSYVLLVGDAVLDYQDRLKSGMLNYVPTQVIEAETWGQTASDNWFVTIAGDDILPDLMIGRLSADSAQQVNDIVAKILGYAQNPPSTEWNTKTLFVADDDAPVFASLQDQLASQLPFYYSANKVYATNYPPNSPTDDIRTRLDAGSILVSYAGHGDALRWGKWDGEAKTLWHVSDIAGLAGSGRLAVVTTANCLNGFFVGITSEPSLAEGFQRAAGKGAVGVFAPTSLGYPSGHYILLSGLLEAVYYDDRRALGVATTQAKLTAYAWSAVNTELVETYVLFGDPATEIGIPTNYPYIESTTPANGATDVPVDTPIRVVFSKPMDPATVTLGGDEVAAAAWTASWNTNNTEVTFTHSDLASLQSYQLSITGKDKLGNTLGQGQAPSQWSFTTADTTQRLFLPTTLR